MSGVDQQKAMAALAYRLRQWGVDAPDVKAVEFITALVGAGWQMDPERETTPARPERATADVSAQVLNLRRNVVPLRPVKTKPEGDESA